MLILWETIRRRIKSLCVNNMQGKSLLLAIYCVIRCILYPGTLIVITSKTRGQSAEIIEKIQTMLMPLSSYLRQEIKPKGISNSPMDAHIEFNNTSKIKTVASNDNSRHNRANVVIIDEFRMVDPNIINTVIRKFNTSPRQPEYLSKPEYKNYPKEMNQEIYASSCWYESSWSFKKARSYCVDMIRGKKKYFICSMPYQVSIMEGLLSKQQVENEMSEGDFDPLAFRMEMESLWIGDNGDSLYKYDDVANCRRIQYAWYPHEMSSKLQDRRVHVPQKKPLEKRILSVDIALMASGKNDNDAASIFINSMNPIGGVGGRYINSFVYTVNYEGMRTDDLALTIRKLYDTYACDYLVIDGKGNGLPVIDLLMNEIFDKETGVTYDPIGCCNNEEINARCVSKTAPKVMWVMLGNPTLNTQCAIILRESLRNGTVRLIYDDYGCREKLHNLQGFSKLSQEDQVDFELPYKNTTLLLNELVNLKFEQNQDAIKVHERSGMRKDRYSSISYNLYVAKQIEREISKPKNTQDEMAKLLTIRSPVIA